MSRTATLAMLAVITLGAIGLSSCGDDDGGGDGSTTTASAEDDGGPDATGDAGAVENACPAEGCIVSITSFEATDGGEIQVEFDANFTPDFSANHIHIYWDTYSADQVSADAADRGVTQGAWVPTDEYPTFVTEGDVSVEKRADSTTLCVTAGDGDHNVLDADKFNCIDVSEAL